LTNLLFFSCFPLFSISGNTFDGLGPWYYGTPLLPHTDVEYRQELQIRYNHYFPSYNRTKKEMHINSIMNNYNIYRYNWCHDPTLSSFIQYDGDFSIICPMKSYSSQLSFYNIPTFSYIFGHLYGLDISAQYGIVDINKTSITSKSNKWGSHTAELPFVFGVNVGPNYLNKSSSKMVPFNSNENVLVDTIQNYWGTFAKVKTFQKDSTGLTEISLLQPKGLPTWKSTVINNLNKEKRMNPHITNIMKFEIQSSTTVASMIDSYHDDKCDAIGEIWSLPTIEKSNPIIIIISICVGCVGLIFIVSILYCYKINKISNSDHRDSILSIDDDDHDDSTSEYHEL
jgi:hypothetical protein